MSVAANTRQRAYGSRQMRISCNPLIFRMRGGKYIHSPLEKGFSNRECGRKSRRIHQYSCGRIRLKTLILQYNCADYWRAIFGLWGCLGWPPVWQTGQQIGSNPIRSTIAGARLSDLLIGPCRSSLIFIKKYVIIYM